ncbi:phosphoglycerate kinase [Patescibacteria group bacterium]|nr:phosphoglycerate kinase [Patescibacteria group bacterium]
MPINNISQIPKLKGKLVVVRLDVNVPLSGKKVLDDSRLRQAVPTLRFLINRGAYPIIVGHLGRPQGKVVSDLSLKPIGYALGKIMRQPVKVLPLSFGSLAIKQAAKKNLILLENIRFESGEDKNEPSLAKQLASLGDLYINEAFSVCHRAAASLVAITKYLPSYAGLALSHEIDCLEQVIKKGTKPVVLLVGGAKIADKLPVIQKLLPRCQYILTAGAVANTFLLARRREVGRSLVDKKSLLAAKKILKKAGKKILLPSDALVTKWPLSTKQALVKSVTLVKKSEAIVDIGPQTIADYAVVLKKAKTIFWAGPLGLTEEIKWSHGTKSLAWLMQARSQGARAYVVAGGGETAAFLHQAKLSLNHISTAGSALLDFLAGQTLPALKALGYLKSKK